MLHILRIYIYIYHHFKQQCLMVTHGDTLIFWVVKPPLFRGKHSVLLPYHGTGCDGLLELQCSAKGKLRPQVAHETWRRRSKQKWE